MFAKASESQASLTVPRGPAKAHILIDDALLKGGQTIIGGTVKNISPETLADLMVELELKRRSNGTLERMKVPLNPTQLEPNQQGSYSLKVPAQQFGSVRLVRLTGAPEATSSFHQGPGQKRPLEDWNPRWWSSPAAIKKGWFLNC